MMKSSVASTSSVAPAPSSAPAPSPSVPAMASSVGANLIRGCLEEGIIPTPGSAIYDACVPLVYMLNAVKDEQGVYCFLVEDTDEGPGDGTSVTLSEPAKPAKPAKPATAADTNPRSKVAHVAVRIDKVHPAWHATICGEDGQLRSSAQLDKLVDILTKSKEGVVVPLAWGSRARVLPIEAHFLRRSSFLVHRCGHKGCTKRFVSIVNARRCTASHACETVYPADALADFWDSLEARERLRIVAPGLVSAENPLEAAGKISAAELLVSLDKAAEGTALATVPRDARLFSAQDIAEPANLDAIIADRVIRELTAACSAANEAALLRELEEETRREAQRSESKRAAKCRAKTRKVLKRLETDNGFFAAKPVIGRTGAWWEDE